MAVQRNAYTPPPRRRTNSVKRELRRRVSGKPTRSSAMMSIPRTIGQLIGRVLLVVLVVTILVGFLFAGIGGGMLAGYISTASDIQIEQIKNSNETTHITDDENQDVAILTGSENINREYISIADVKSTYIADAFKAIEDERFDTHIGIDPKRIGSAIFSALTNGGTATHGGSTITQQTVKLISGDDERSAQRKIQEWYNAIRLEQKKTKDEIMELYVNLVPMGNSYVGIQSAAKAYFDKNASELNLTECAFLAGIPNRPSTYNPLTESGRRNALRRMRIVLGKMYELGSISEAEHEEALNTELVFRKTPQTVSANQVNSYFVDYVIESVVNDLVEKRGYSEKMAWLAVYNNGLHIETTLDQTVQAKAEAIFNTESLFVTDPAILPNIPSGPQGSVTIIENDPNPGQVKAMVGGYGEKTANFVLNRATSARRQPGSSIKPIYVYGPALDTGKITAATIVTDQPYYFDPANPTTVYPKNSESGYLGNIPVRTAVEKSKNTIAAYIWKEVLTGETALSYLKQVGIDRSTENYVATAVGGFNIGMTTLEMAGGFATLANEGLYTEPYVYTRVLDADGNVLLENKPTFAQVYKIETAFVMTDILTGVLIRGTAGGHAVKNMASAGKTGTTDDNIDKWFCGYTPYYTAAVWYGYDNENGRRTKIPSGDLSNAIKIWEALMNSIHEGLEYRDFERPSTVLTATVCNESGMLATPNCPSTRTEYFIPGVIINPSQPCTLHTRGPTPEVTAGTTPIQTTVAPVTP